MTWQGGGGGGSARVLDPSGVPVASAQLQIVEVVGPASYSVGGFAVDVSAAFSSLLGVFCERGFTTATKSLDPRIPLVHESGANTFANRKFILRIWRGVTPSASFAGSALGTHAHAGSTFTSVWTGSQTLAASGLCVAATCNNNHPGLTNAPSSTIPALTSLAAQSAGTPAGTITGNDPTNAFEEIANGVNLSAITYRMLCVGAM